MKHIVFHSGATISGVDFFNSKIPLMFFFVILRILCAVFEKWTLIMGQWFDALYRLNFGMR